MRTKKWVITSAKWTKTVIVSVSARKAHPKYKKMYTVTKKYHAHDESNSLVEWQEIVIQECNPISKLKKWVVIS